MTQFRPTKWDIRAPLSDERMLAIEGVSGDGLQKRFDDARNDYLENNFSGWNVASDLGALYFCYLTRAREPDEESFGDSGEEIVLPSGVKKERISSAVTKETVQARADGLRESLISEKGYSREQAAAQIQYLFHTMNDAFFPPPEHERQRSIPGARKPQVEMDAEEFQDMQKRLQDIIVPSMKKAYGGHRREDGKPVLSGNLIERLEDLIGAYLAMRCGHMVEQDVLKVQDEVKALAGRYAGQHMAANWFAFNMICFFALVSSKI